MAVKFRTDILHHAPKFFEAAQWSSGTAMVNTKGHATGGSGRRSATIFITRSINIGMPGVGVKRASLAKNVDKPLKGECGVEPKLVELWRWVMDVQLKR